MDSSKIMILNFLVIFMSFFAVCLCSTPTQNQNSTTTTDYIVKRDYISWDDMKVEMNNVHDYDEHDKGRLGAGEEYMKINSSKVIIVDKNGTGDSVTIQGAVDMIPENNSERVKILILPGIYREKVVVPKSKAYISFIGNESHVNETVISWSDKASDNDSNGHELGTYDTASVTIFSDFFCATGITFENTVVATPGGEGMQAVALRVSGDKAMFYRVRILGTQDTLLDDTGSHYFYQCHIQGSVDFIFGRARSLYQECVLHSIAERSGAIAAHHRDLPNENTGFSFVNCVINGSGKIYLGRAWGDYSRMIFAYSFIDDIITPSGWSDWNLPNRQKTAVVGEYQCHGKGANTTQRVPWSRNFNYDEIQRFLNLTYIDGTQWLRL